MATKNDTFNLTNLKSQTMKHRQFSCGKFLPWFGLIITLIGTLTYFTQHTVIFSFDTRLPGLYIILTGIALSIINLVQELKGERVAWQKRIDVKLLSISLVLTALYIGNAFFIYQQEKVKFINGDVVLAGTLLIPKGDGPHPALVMMHGAGESTRMGMFAEAQSLARAGIAVLIYDKRGSGETVGGHYRYDGYEALASDGVAAFNFLKHRSDINPNQIGLWGTSEGGWTALMAASKVDDPTFLIIITGGPMTPEEQGAYSIEHRLRLQGFSDKAVNQALELYAQYNAYIRTGLGRDGLLASVQQAQGAPWLEATFTFGITVPEYEELSEHQQWWRDHMGTDVAPLLEQIDFPILYVLGADDPLIPATLVKTQVESILGAVGHEDFSVEIFPEATHNLMAAPTDCGFCLPNEIVGPFLPWFANGYLDIVSTWATQRVDVAY